MSPHSISVQLPAAVAGLMSESVLTGYGNLATGGDFSPSSKEVKTQLAGLTPGCLFDGSVSNLAMADGCLAGLWLLHGFLDESHDISQSLKTSEGSFWHGIMHRIERDFWNSKYWYRQVGSHQVIETMATRDSSYPEGLVDACERACEAGGDAEVAVDAIAEWICLFEFCYNSAV